MVATLGESRSILLFTRACRLLRAERVAIEVAAGAAGMNAEAVAAKATIVAARESIYVVVISLSVFA